MGEKTGVKINYFFVAADAENIADSLWELKKKSAISKYFLQTQLTCCKLGVFFDTAHFLAGDSSPAFQLTDWEDRLFSPGLRTTLCSPC